MVVDTPCTVYIQMLTAHTDSLLGLPVNMTVTDICYIVIWSQKKPHTAAKYRSKFLLSLNNDSSYVVICRLQFAASLKML